MFVRKIAPLLFFLIFYQACVFRIHKAPAPADPPAQQAP